MTRATFVMRCGQLVDKRTAPPLICTTDARVHVIGDVMDPVQHPVTGKVYDSKARFRAETRATGCIEVGTDPAARRDAGARGRWHDGWGNQGSVADDVKRALQELRSR